MNVGSDNHEIIFELWESDVSQRGLEAQTVRRKEETSNFVVTNIQGAFSFVTL
jgi:hypothetical protein